ncbi:MAG: hypothetical protein ABWJ97_06505 [Thermoproteus sp.]
MEEEDLFVLPQSKKSPPKLVLETLERLLAFPDELEKMILDAREKAVTEGFVDALTLDHLLGAVKDILKAAAGLVAYILPWPQVAAMELARSLGVSPPSRVDGRSVYKVMEDYVRSCAEAAHAEAKRKLRIPEEDTTRTAWHAEDVMIAVSDCLREVLSVVDYLARDAGIYAPSEEKK